MKCLQISMFLYYFLISFYLVNVIWKRSGSLWLLNNGIRQEKCATMRGSCNAMSRWCIDLVREAFTVFMTVNVNQRYSMPTNERVWLKIHISTKIRLSFKIHESVGFRLLHIKFFVKITSINLLISIFKTISINR